jgi:hypothetical protein
MKKSFSLVMFTVMCVSISTAQNVKKGYYKFNQDEIQALSPQQNVATLAIPAVAGVAAVGGAPAIPATSAVAAVPVGNVKIYEGYIIKVVAINAATGIINYRYIKIKGDGPHAKLYNDREFTMNSAAFIIYTDPIYSRYKGVKAGIYTVPFRLRDIGGKNFDFESSLSLQTNVVFGFGSTNKKYSLFDASFGIGITSVNITPSNSNLLLAEDSRTASAFTWSIGGLIKPSQVVNFGVFFGVDHLGLKDKSTGWIYNNKLWVGLGINISLKKIDKNNSLKPSLNKKQKTLI